MLIEETSKTSKLVTSVVKLLKEPVKPVNSQRITHALEKPLKPVKQWFILVLRPAIGTHSR